MPKSAMAKQGPVATLHPPKVPQGAIKHDGYLRHLGGIKYNKKCSQTFDDYMRGNAQFGYGRTGSYYNIPSPRGASRSHRVQWLLEALLRELIQEENPKTFEDYIGRNTQFSYGRTRSYYNIPSPLVPQRAVKHNGYLRHLGEGTTTRNAQKLWKII